MTDNLSKELPRIPRVKSAKDFWAFSKAGRALAELHVGYERVRPFGASVEVAGGKELKDLKAKDFRVEKMSYGGTGNEKTAVTIFSKKVTVSFPTYSFITHFKSPNYF